jgi:DoxX-like family
MNQTPALTWTGRVLSALPTLLLLMSAAAKLSGQKEAVEGFAAAGYPDGVVVWVGVAELLSALLYAVPYTTLFGLALCTGYLGGAVCHHVRLGEAPFAPVLIGVVMWVGLALREPRFRELVLKPRG